MMNKPDSKTPRAKARVQTESCSFDVFDTFLLRACTTSEGVFERAFQLSPVSERLPGSAATYVQHRIQAEARARAAAKEKRGTYEVTIDEIYAYFPFRLFDIDRTALQDLADAELQAEFDLCRVNSDMLRRYREAQNAGQRTGFISDTYWNERQLSALLRHCCPGLNWDFLYVSCENGSSKSEALFQRYLVEQRIYPAAALHIGDNENSDIRGARRHGIRARFYPQASNAFAAQLQRESSISDLLCRSDTSRLDHGSRTLRRAVAACTAEKSPAFHLGVTTLGPAMAGFDAFIERQVARLRKTTAEVRVAFLGRDGFLPLKIRHAFNADAGSYVEINRRVSLIASATTIEPLVELFRKVAKIDAATFSEIVKVLPPSVTDFFGRFPGGIASGKELAEALPQLLDEDQIARIATAMRTELLAYLRQSIPGFDACSDLVLVDLGYSGSIQKALRRIFDCEGITTLLHGVYLMTLDDAFDDLAADDTAVGFISDLVVTPHFKRMLTRNIALLEQMCCSPAGSVRDYRDGTVLRESNPRPEEQLALIAEIQAGALAFIGRARELAPSYKLQPFAAPDVAARWTAVILGRLLLLPNDDELVMLGSLKHDINLGTQALAPMLDVTTIRNMLTAQGLPAACTAAAPPMWLAASFAAVSPAHGFLYTLFGANLLPAEIFGDTKCGTVQIGLFGANGSATMESVSCYRTGLGEMRIRVPISRNLGIKTIAVPLANIAPEGILHGVAVQTGKTVRKASRNIDIATVPDNKLIAAGLDRSGRYYRASDENGCLMITVELPEDPVAIFSIALTSLSNDRILTQHDATSSDKYLVAALLDQDSRTAPQPIANEIQKYRQAINSPA